jgi:large subunit ribosomal protein L18
MTDINITKRKNRQRRHARIRATMSGTAERPRVAVFKSNRTVYIQAVDDVARTTIAAVNDGLLKKKGTKTEKAMEAGKKLAELLKAKKVDTVVFDKGGFTFHGRVKAIADGLKEGGIKV